MNKKTIIILAGVVCLALGAYAAFNVTNSYPDGGTAGIRVSRNSRLNVLESKMVHRDTSSGSDGLVNIGNPVLIGDVALIGVAQGDASASDVEVAIDTEGIFNLAVINSSHQTTDYGDVIWFLVSNGDLVTTTVGTRVLFGHSVSTTDQTVSTTSTFAVRLAHP